MNPPSVTRRRSLGLLGAAALAAPFSRLFGQQEKPPTEKPSTNIQDAAKHPRGPNAMPGKFPGKVVRCFNDTSFVNAAPDPKVLDRMVTRTLLELTGASTVSAAWRMFVSPDDVVGLKVNPVAGKLLSTSPEIVHVIIEQLLRAGIPKDHLVIWDRRAFELQEVGFTPDQFPGIAITGTERKDDKGSFYDAEGKLYSEKILDRDWYYWADVEEKYDNETFPYMINEGKYSYFTSVCTRDISKIINIPILKNAGASVTLCLKNLAFGSISNTSRLHKKLWAETCAEVPAFSPLRDKVVLNIVDGIKGCYQGGPAANPQFIVPFHTVLAGTDPVAVDCVGYEMILKKRIAEKIQKEDNAKGRNFLKIAQDLGLGKGTFKDIEVAEIS